MFKLRLRKALFGAFCAIAFAGSAHSAQLITNGGFEGGGAGWATTPTVHFLPVSAYTACCSPFGVYPYGSDAAFFGAGDTTGGTLYQDIETQVPGAIRHDYFPGFPRDYLAHQVSITAGSRLHAAARGSTMPVNSMHHQAVKTLAPGLVATARAEDGVIEAIESEGPGYLVGVQWHPEVFEKRDERTRRLFEGFITAARGEG